MLLLCVTRDQLVDTERKHDTPQKLALGLLLLLFSTDELAHGNCTKPVWADILQLDSERLLAIKCKLFKYYHLCILTLLAHRLLNVHNEHGATSP